VTNQYFNEYARTQAGFNDVDLITRDEFKELVVSFPITNIDFEQAMLLHSGPI
jgi:hypothetical protein